MYFVDRKKIEEKITYMDDLLHLLEKHTFSSELELFARERITHVLIESLLDVGNMMIDGFIMRDPGSYEDIIDILIDERVIPEDEESLYKEFIGLRRNIVIEYLDVNQEELSKVIENASAVLKEFSTHIRTYLQNELGVANAFLKE